MIAVLATLAVFVCQEPPTQDKARARAPADRDVITLQGGEQVVGTILKQVGNYIEVRIDEHTVVGFERSRIRHINAAKKAPVVENTRLPAKDEWFLLHDERGLSRGSMHALIQHDPNGEIRVSEEWYFKTESGRTQVTRIETLDENLAPLKTFYHERVLSKRDRIASERLLSGEVLGGYLKVRRRSLRGQSEHRYPFPKNAQFPLSYRAEIRRDEGTQIVAANQELFDASTGEFVVVQTSTVSRRKVELLGKQLHVREITLDRGGRKNSEWVDANHHVVRREVNGASLVAVRVSEARARRALVVDGPTGLPSAIAATEDGGMAVWLPNPVWTVSSLDTSRISIEAPLYAGKATLMMLEQIPKEVGLASAADQMLRWLRLSIGTDIRVLARGRTQVQRAPAVRLVLRWATTRPGESKSFRGVCHVFRVRGRYAALFCSTTRANFNALDVDFRRILDSVQLDPQDIAPRLQGPKQAVRR